MKQKFKGFHAIFNSTLIETSIYSSEHAVVYPNILDCSIFTNTDSQSMANTNQIRPYRQGRFHQPDGHSVWTHYERSVPGDSLQMLWLPDICAEGEWSPTPYNAFPPGRPSQAM